MTGKRAKPYTHYHSDGTVWAKGQTTDGVMTGSWEWFRKDGSKMRSGHFDAEGKQTGEWTTFDRKSGIVKVTKMKAKAPPSKKRASSQTKS